MRFRLDKYSRLILSPRIEKVRTPRTADHNKKLIADFRCPEINQWIAMMAGVILMEAAIANTRPDNICFLWDARNTARTVVNKKRGCV